jgi:hypothetical protein
MSRKTLDGFMDSVSDVRTPHVIGGAVRAYALRAIGERLLHAVIAVLLAWSPLALAASAGKPSYTGLPQRQAGLWEVTVQAHSPRGLGGPRQEALTVLQCTDANAERVVPFFLLPAPQGCSSITVKRDANGAGHEVATVCATHGQRTDMQLKLWGDMRDVYGGTYTVSKPGAPLGNTGPVPFQARWLGTCKAGQRAGDMVLPNGITVNTVDDAKRAAEHTH